MTKTSTFSTAIKVWIAGKCRINNIILSFLNRVIKHGISHGSDKCVDMMPYVTLKNGSQN